MTSTTCRTRRARRPSTWPRACPAASAGSTPRSCWSGRGERGGTQRRHHGHRPDHAGRRPRAGLGAGPRRRDGRPPDRPLRRRALRGRARRRGRRGGAGALPAPPPQAHGSLLDAGAGGRRRRAERQRRRSRRRRPRPRRGVDRQHARRLGDHRAEPAQAPAGARGGSQPVRRLGVVSDRPAGPDQHPLAAQGPQQDLRRRHGQRRARARLRGRRDRPRPRRHGARGRRHGADHGLHLRVLRPLGPPVRRRLPAVRRARRGVPDRRGRGDPRARGRAGRARARRARLRPPGRLGDASRGAPQRRPLGGRRRAGRSDRRRAQGRGHRTLRARLRRAGRPGHARGRSRRGGGAERRARRHSGGRSAPPPSRR